MNLRILGKGHGEITFSVSTVFFQRGHALHSMQPMLHGYSLQPMKQARHTKYMVPFVIYFRRRGIEDKVHAFNKKCGLYACTTSVCPSIQTKRHQHEHIGTLCMHFLQDDQAHAFIITEFTVHCRRGRAGGEFWKHWFAGDMEQIPQLWPSRMHA